MRSVTEANIIMRQYSPPASTPANWWTSVAHGVTARRVKMAFLLGAFICILPYIKPGV